MGNIGGIAGRNEGCPRSRFITLRVEYRHPFARLIGERKKCQADFEEGQMRTKGGTIGIDSIVILIALVMAVLGFAYGVLHAVVFLTEGKRGYPFAAL